MRGNTEELNVDARAFSTEQLAIIAAAELGADEDAAVFEEEPTEEMAKAMCAQHGHMPTRVTAENGFTYVWVCERCGKSL